MTTIALPDGLMAMIKAATRALILACGGAATVKSLTGASDGQISRWQGDAYPDVIPAWAVGVLEFNCQQPAFTRMMAGLTGHRLTPIAEEGGDEPGSRDFVGDLVSVAGAASKVTAGMSDALADGKVTPGEAKGGLANIASLERELTVAKRRLSVVAGGAA